MKTFARSVRRFILGEEGPTAVEYAVMLALIVVVCLTTITKAGNNSKKAFNKVKTAIKSSSS